MGREMKLSESLSHVVEDIFNYEDSNLSIDPEDFKALLDLDESKGMSQDKVAIYAQIVDNTQKMIDETNFTPNIAGYVGKIQPLLRRIVPGLLAFEVCGVQPVSIPTSAIFALKADYSGSKEAPISMDREGARIIVLKTPLDAEPAIGDDIDFGDGVTGKVEYVDDAKTFIVKLDDISKVPVAGTSQVNGIDVEAVYSNSIAFKKVLKNYSGPYATEVGEKLGDDMNQLRIYIDKMDVTVETRKLKAEFTIEIMQDLRAFHGVAAEEELTNFLEQEIRLELDRSIIEKLKDVATITPDFKVSDSAGRWSMEMYEGLYQRISYEANKIAKESRRGRGNKMIASPGVVSALQSLKRFKDIQTSGNLMMAPNPSEVFVGTLENGIDVYMDWFSDDEYVLLTYKGETNIDAGLIFSPYHLLTFTDVRSYVTHQPAVGVMSRYGLTANGLLDDNGGSSYTRTFNVDFTGTALA